MRILALTIFFLILSPTDLMAQGHLSCRELLTKYIEALKDSDSTRMSLKSIGENLARTEKISVADRFYFYKAEQIAPLFNSGIVQKAIAEEFIKQGFKTKKALTQATRNFHSISSAEEKITTIESIIYRISYMVDEEISLDPARLKVLEKHAKSFKMDLAEYTKFVKAWNLQQKSDPTVNKLALLMTMESEALKEGTSYFARDVGRLRSWTSRFKGLFTRKTKMLMVPHYGDVTYSDLILSSAEAYRSQDIKHFVEEAELLPITSFFENAYQYLTLEQLKWAVAEPKVATSLPKEILNNLNARLQSLEGEGRRLIYLAKNIAGLDKEISDLEKQKDLIYNPPILNGRQLDSSAMNQILKLVTVTRTSADFPPPALKEVFMGFLRLYVDKISPTQFVDLSITIMDDLDSYGPAYMTVEEDMSEAIREASLKFPLTDSQVSQIKVQVQKNYVRSTDPIHNRTMDDILLKTWGMEIPSPKLTPEDSQKISDIDQKLSDLNAAKNGFNVTMEKMKDALKSRGVE